MEKNKNQISLLEDQDQIVNNYLEALLSEVAEYSEPEVKTRQETAEIVTIGSTREITSERVQRTVELMAELAEKVAASQEVREAPDWAQERFQCLLITVQGITMAIPLLALDNIVKWEADLTLIPAQPPWHLGVLHHRDHKIVVVDLPRLLMPEKQDGIPAKRENGSHILIIGDNRFGLACDSLAKPMVLTKEDVHWSVVHPDRPWMAGTIREKLAVILDAKALLQMIRHE
jgi:purine-binding chemotaxis protein CheW